jgi:dUTPase
MVRKQVYVVNTTIDCNKRKPVKITLHNHSKIGLNILKGDTVCDFVLQKVAIPKVVTCDVSKKFN